MDEKQAGSSGRRGRKETRDTLLACAFCGRSQHELSKLIAGPGIYICDACVEQAEGVISTGTAAGTELGAIHTVPEQEQRARCSFCGKSRDQVTGLAAMVAQTGSKAAEVVAICTECLSKCNEILAEELA